MNINGQVTFSKDNSHNTFLYGNIAEYDKLFQNRNKISKVDRGSSMKQEDCKHLERKQNGMQVILEFPRKSENEEDIKIEVKGILASILQEHLTKSY